MGVFAVTRSFGIKLYSSSRLVGAFLQAENSRFVKVMRIAHTKNHFRHCETSPWVRNLYRRTSLNEYVLQRHVLGSLSYSSTSNNAMFCSTTVFGIKFSMNKSFFFKFSFFSL